MERNRPNRVLCTAFAACAFLLAACLAAPAAAFAASAIVFPSDAETTVAKGRDLYVIGTGDDLVARGVTIELLDSNGNAVRTLDCDANKNALGRDAAVPALDHFFNDKARAIPDAEIVMPDLGYEVDASGAAISGSSTNPANKVSVTEKNFSALILGGESGGGADPAFEGLGIKAQTYLAGSYTLQVNIGTATPGDPSDDETLTKAITFATTAAKVAGRFSPDGHMAALKAFADKNGLRTYLDPFPGYWSPQNLGCIYYKDGDGNYALYTKRDIFLESYARWRTADALEYEEGKVHLCIYNINPSSATQSVEIAALQRTQRIDTDTTCYYYDLGEPSLSNAGQTLKGSIVPFPAGDKLVFARSQAGADTGADNEFKTYLDYNDAIDKDFADGITAPEGQQIAFFGAVAPIQNVAGDIVKQADCSYDFGTAGKLAACYTYTMKTDIDSIAYDFVRDGKSVYTTTRSVDLVRDFSEDWTSAESTYEFKHCFSLEGVLGAGDYTVRATALDTKGNEVPGGSETFTLTVQGPNKPVSPLAKTGDSAALPFCAAVLCLAAAAALGAAGRSRRNARL